MKKMQWRWMKTIPAWIATGPYGIQLQVELTPGGWGWSVWGFFKVGNAGAMVSLRLGGPARSARAGQRLARKALQGQLEHWFGARAESRWVQPV
jgi:hypothetical protein